VSSTVSDAPFLALGAEMTAHAAVTHGGGSCRGRGRGGGGGGGVAYHHLGGSDRVVDSF